MGDVKFNQNREQVAAALLPVLLKNGLISSSVTIHNENRYGAKRDKPPFCIAERAVCRGLRLLFHLLSALQVHFQTIPSFRDALLHAHVKHLLQCFNGCVSRLVD